MFIFKVSDSVAKTYTEEVYKSIYKKHWSQPIYYVINSKFRKSVHLVRWLEEQVKAKPSLAMEEVLNSFQVYENPDKVIRQIQAWVINNIEYVGDLQQYNTQEYWATAEETLISEEGDCDDGAVLMYVLARKMGIPAHRLFIAAGNVQIGRGAQQGGHAWLYYIPYNYPLNFVPIDWCYYPNTVSMDFQDKVFIKGDKIYGPQKHKYNTIWFIFNETSSFKQLFIKQ